MRRPVVSVEILEVAFALLPQLQQSVSVAIF
jgi:hypothetical protein